MYLHIRNGETIVIESGIDKYRVSGVVGKIFIEKLGKDVETSEAEALRTPPDDKNVVGIRAGDIL